MKHTKGPWRIREEAGTLKGQYRDMCVSWVLDSPTRAFMAGIEVWKNDTDPGVIEEVRANAHLIAAAPELYRVVTAIVDYYTKPGTDDWVRFCKEVLEPAKEAINQAKGGSK